MSYFHCLIMWKPLSTQTKEVKHLCSNQYFQHHLLLSKPWFFSDWFQEDFYSSHLCFQDSLRKIKDIREFIRKLSNILNKIFQNTGLLWPFFALLSRILSLYGKMQVSENPRSCMYYKVTINSNLNSSWLTWDYLPIIYLRLFSDTHLPSPLSPQIKCSQFILDQ